MRNKILFPLIGLGTLLGGCVDSNSGYLNENLPIPPAAATPPPEPPPPPAPQAPNDVSGTWFMRIEQNAMNCGTGESIDAQTMVITQSGADVSILTSRQDTYVGSVAGDIVDWAGSYAERGGMANFTSATAVFTENGVDGNAAWTWSNGTDSCNGTMTISAATDIALEESFANSYPEIADEFTFTDNVAFFEGSIGVGKDEFDYFAFTAESDGTIQIELSHFDTNASNLDLMLMDENLDEVASSQLSDGFERVEAAVAGGAKYYILVDSASLSGPDSYYLSVDMNN